MNTNSPTANAVFYRSYSRRLENGKREDWDTASDRWIKGLRDIKPGSFTEKADKLLDKYIKSRKVLPSGRWMWVGGTEWGKKPENTPGFYNCSSLEVDQPWVFGYLMELAMMGCGTGAVLENHIVAKLPPVKKHPAITEVVKNQVISHLEDTYTFTDITNKVWIVVGDSRQGWVKAYQYLINHAFGLYRFNGDSFGIDISHVRDSGKPLKGFGGVANPVKLQQMFEQVCEVISSCPIGEQLTPLQVCLLLDWAALAVVAGSIRRSAGMRQFSASQPNHKAGLWKQDEQGNWSIDPSRDALRMANHTRVFHEKPDYQTILDSVTSQYYTGEGAIQYAPTAITRSQNPKGYALNPCGR